ncbi:50S ribosomal protein L12 [Arthroderma uncinatum]|uniref:50S ribosomal protein L12 n=1 Tax=Arthroderma uncinatum TaxID=74035 RepID=UPI00144AE3DC|nr:50S ribosomal protein L12 [Arthroderma uncinatum]KAF3483507.1 50S ribosomal protein L12 [Arthroderma uncinatum]
MSLATRCCRSAIRLSSASASIRTSSQVTRLNASTSYITQRRRYESTAAEPAAPTSEKITKIVDQISQLTLLETADLVASLKTRLNIPDLPVGGFAAGPGGPAPAAAVEEEEAAPAAQEKTLFNLKLESFDAGSKAKIIKEVKSMLGLSLVESKKFVESVPKVIKESVPKEEAEKIVATLKALGAVATLD